MLVYFKGNMLVREITKKVLEYIIGSKIIYTLLKRCYLERVFPYIQVVTYHDTPENMEDSIRKQLGWYQDNFVNCNIADLDNLIMKGEWKYDRPGLIISFDDGLRTNLNVALPLLEEYGFTGWFMIPSGWLDLSYSEQIKFAKLGLIEYSDNDYKDNIAISWKDLRDIEQRGHVVSCHTMNHKRLSNNLTLSELDVEIAGAKNKLESELKHEVDIFTWVGGEEWSYSKMAFKQIQNVGFKYIFCTNCAPITAKQSPLFLERYHVEPDFNEKKLRLVLGGFYDFLYAAKRKRIKKCIVT